MSDALERLRKILKLEQQLGYRNKAVIGGLERLSERWRVDASQEAGNPAQQALAEDIIVRLSQYGSLESHQARKDAVTALLAQIERWPDAGVAAARVNAVIEKKSEPKAPPTPSAAPEPSSERRPAPSVALDPWSERRPAPASHPAAPPSIAPRPTPVGSASLQASVSRLPGVGPSHTEQLAKMDIHTVGDLLWLLPRRYDDFSSLKLICQLQAGEEVTIIANVWDMRSQRLPGRNAAIFNGLLGDSSATIKATWFSPYVVKQLRVGQTYVFSGKVDSYLGRLVLRNPRWENLDREQIHTGRLVPVYPLTKGITANWMRTLQRKVVETWGKRVYDHLPEEVRQRANLLALSEALEQVHFPDNRERLQAARRRLAFDEFFFIQIGVLRQRKVWLGQPAQPLPLTPELAGAFDQMLPFQLTAAQARASANVQADLGQLRPMSRLLQGDVGSGKTVVAAKAMWAAAVNGAQAAMMAPTEILAEQHYRGLSKLFANLTWQGRPVRVALLTGSQKAGDRADTLQGLATGEVAIAIGTHALVQEGVQFHNLGVVIIDEQHRFGVRQRALLRQKGLASAGAAAAAGDAASAHSPVPHLLVMSATPIPRTLSLTIFGDLDASVIDEMPPGRQPIKTRWLMPRERERAYAFLRRQVAAGRQGFIIYPLVEESEALNARAAVPEYEQLYQQVFPDLRLGLLHGRLKAEEKDAAMQAMQRGDIDILVATSVVEVGIDIPNATVIMIEDAERFGLAQLHQFRGRVGRGEHPSYCILISDATTPNAVERLQALEQSQDGFALAEKDLQLRGPGDFFGVRQSGLPDLKLAQLSDLRTLELARTEATRLLEVDPELSQPQHLALARKVRQFWHGEGDIS